VLVTRLATQRHSTQPVSRCERDAAEDEHDRQRLDAEGSAPEPLAGAGFMESRDGG
jgi:hypothetical protein